MPVFEPQARNTLLLIVVLEVKPLNGPNPRQPVNLLFAVFCIRTVSWFVSLLFHGSTNNIVMIFITINNHGFYVVVVIVFFCLS